MEILSIYINNDELNALSNEMKVSGVEFSIIKRHQVGAHSADSIIQIISVVGNATMWASIASILIAYIKTRAGRKITITTKSGDLLQAEGLSKDDLAKILIEAKNIRLHNHKK